MKKNKGKERDSRPFSQRHPKLSFLVSLLVLAGLCVAGYYLVILLSRGFETFINWIASITSKLEAVVVVALITGMLSLISVIVTKRIDYRRARDEYLAKKREEPYGGFVNMVYKIMDNGRTPGSYSESEMKNDLLSFSKEITLWGSPKVAKKWVEFRQNGVNPNKAFGNLFIIEDIMNEMRKDLGMKKMKRGGLLSFFVNDINQLKQKNK